MHCRPLFCSVSTADKSNDAKVSRTMLLLVRDTHTRTRAHALFSLGQTYARTLTNGSVEPCPCFSERHTYMRTRKHAHIHAHYGERISRVMLLFIRHTPTQYKSNDEALPRSKLLRDTNTHAHTHTHAHSHSHTVSHTRTRAHMSHSLVHSTI